MLMGLKVLDVSFLGSFRFHGVCTTVHIRRCRGHAVWTMVSATCSLHLTVSPLVGAYAVRSDPHHMLIPTIAQDSGRL